MRCSCDRLCTYLGDRIQFQDKKLLGSDLGRIIYSQGFIESVGLVFYLDSVVKFLWDLCINESHLGFYLFGGTKNVNVIK